MLRKRIALAMISLLLVLLLVSCGEKEVPADPGVISYPGLAWNMTREEVIRALDIDEKDILPNGKQNNSFQQAFCVDNWEFMGETGTILFEFCNFTTDRAEDYFGLRRVVVFYPESADASKLEKKMTSMLGEGEPIRDGKWIFWSGEKKYTDYMEVGFAELKEKYPDKYEEKLKIFEGNPATHATLHFNAEDGIYMNLAPYEGWDGTGITISFYSDHLDLLQCAEFGMKLPE